MLGDTLLKAAAGRANIIAAVLAAKDVDEGVHLIRRGAGISCFDRLSMRIFLM